MALCEHENKACCVPLICPQMLNSCTSDSANLNSQAPPGKLSPHVSTELSSTFLYCGNPPWPTDVLNYCFQNKG